MLFYWNVFIEMFFYWNVWQNKYLSFECVRTAAGISVPSHSQTKPWGSQLWRPILIKFKISWHVQTSFLNCRDQSRSRLKLRFLNTLRQYFWTVLVKSLYWEHVKNKTLGTWGFGFLNSPEFLGSQDVIFRTVLIESLDQYNVKNQDLRDFGTWLFKLSRLSGQSRHYFLNCLDWKSWLRHVETNPDLHAYNSLSYVHSP